MFAIRQPTHVFYSKKAIYSTCRGGEDSRRRVLQTEEIAHTHPQCSHILGKDTITTSLLPSFILVPLPR